MAKIKESTVEERVNPITIRNPENGKAYVLDFNRESVAFAERREFEMDNLLKFPVSNFPELFYLSFRANHGPGKGNISKLETDKIYEALGGYSPEFLERLIALYNQAALSNNMVESTEEMGKNSGWTVEL